MSTEQTSTRVVHEDPLGTYLREHIAASHAAEDLSVRLRDRTRIGGRSSSSGGSSTRSKRSEAISSRCSNPWTTTVG